MSTPWFSMETWFNIDDVALKNQPMLCTVCSGIFLPHFFLIAKEVENSDKCRCHLISVVKNSCLSTVRWIPESEKSRSICHHLGRQNQLKDTTDKTVNVTEYTNHRITRINENEIQRYSDTSLLNSPWKTELTKKNKTEMKRKREKEIGNFYKRNWGMTRE